MVKCKQNYLKYIALATEHVYLHFCFHSIIFATLLLLFFLVLPHYCYQPISLHPHAHMLSHVIPWTSARQTTLSMDFSRQEY